MGAAHEHRASKVIAQQISDRYKENNTPEVQYQRIVSSRIFDLEDRLELSEARLLRATTILAEKEAALNRVLLASSNSLGEALKELSVAERTYPLSLKENWHSFVDGSKIPKHYELNIARLHYGTDLSYFEALIIRDKATKKIQQLINNV